MKKSVRKIFPALGTVNTIDLPSCPDENIIQSAADKVLELHRRLSAFDPTSDVSRINASAGAGCVPVHPDTLCLLERAVSYAKASDGAFDPTVRPLVTLWGFGGRPAGIPDKHEIRRVKNLVSWTDILIDKANCSVGLRRPGQSVDLGGIAKGFALDEVRRLLTENGVGEAVVDLGGSVAVLGSSKAVGIRHPDKPDGGIMGRVTLRDACAVTSGSYEKYRTLGGKRYHHILDPRTGRPSESGILSVTLIGPCAEALDALSTAVFVLGAKKGAELAESFGASCVLIDTERNVFASDSLINKFKIDQEV